MKEEILSEKIITQTEIKALDDVFKLFTGETSATYDIRNKSFRLPNIFNIAGTSSTAS
jgi:hypothetical protein